MGDFLIIVKYHEYYEYCVDNLNEAAHLQGAWIFLAIYGENARTYLNECDFSRIWVHTEIIAADRVK